MCVRVDVVVIATVDAQLHMHRSAVEATASYHIIEGILLKPLGLMRLEFRRSLRNLRLSSLKSVTNSSAGWPPDAATHSRVQGDFASPSYVSSP